jgi:hypothetical protein
MAYQVRFESNAFEADSMIGKMLNALTAFSRGVQKISGVKIRSEEVDRFTTLRGINQRTFERAMDWADKDFDQEMTNVKWDWPRSTARKNGEKVSSPRDIVDTGTLLNSKRREAISANITEFIWDDTSQGFDVATAVHDGGRTKKGGDIPARPWTDHALDEIDTVVDAIINQERR